MTKDAIQRAVSSAVSDAIDFVQSEIEPERRKAARYFDGEVDIGAEVGRSKVVATKCRDAVRAVKPSLLRVFMSTDKPVEYVPRKPQDVAIAEQQTAYAQFAFAESAGFRLLSSVFHDALIKKTGIAKAWWDEAPVIEIDDYSDLTDDEFAMIAGDDEVEVLEHSARVEMMQGPMGPVPLTLHDAKVSRQSTEGRLAMKPVPPEDFFIDRNATSLDDASICGHRSEMKLGDLVAMGFAMREIEDLGTDRDDDETEFVRRGYTVDDADDYGDPSLKPVTVYEAYMRLDIEGTGTAQLYSFILAGGGKKLLRYDLCDQMPFAVFEIDPEPHAFFGRSLVDILTEDQDAGTAMLRGLLDNVAASNNPRLAFDEANVNIDDLTNNEIGALIRTRGAPGDKLMPVTVPDMGSQSLGAIQYFDSVIESKTGVSRASLGLDADALQSTTAAAVRATVAGAEGQVEVMARNLAEGGMKQLFRIILKLTQQHASPDEMMRVDGRFIPVDPRSWNVGMALAVNVGLGTNRREERAMALRETLQSQLGIWQTMGPVNGLVTLTHIRNTLADILDASGIHNADRHYAPMDPQTEQAMMQQAQQAQQGQTDPNAALAQAEVQKAQISAQAKQQGDAIRAQVDMQKAQMSDDLARDEMEQKAIIDAAKIYAEFQRKAEAADAESIRQLQARPRF